MQTIGKYQLLRELGRGATGKVYLADDPFAKRKVAVKVAFPEALKSNEDGALYKSMFLNEAALAGKLNHPHIVQIYDAVVEDKYSYIVMEYVEGGTLEKFCKPDALLETRDVAEISFKCVRALAFAHTLGLTHRDIKPGNILHSDGTEIKIADFGASINKVSDRTVITNVGSPAYMAPELVQGQVQASHLTDIYAMGVVMYYLLAGRLPFSGANTLSRDLPDREHRSGAAVDASRGHLAGARRRRDEGHGEGPGQALRDVGRVRRGAGGDLEEGAQGRGEARAVRHRALQRDAQPALLQGFPRERAVGSASRSASGPSSSRIPPSSRKATTATRSSCSPAATCASRAARRRSRCSPRATASARCRTSPRKGDPHRSATVTTTSDAIVIKIRAEDLRSASLSCRRLFDERFLNTLVERLEKANEQISVMS